MQFARKQANSVKHIYKGYQIRNDNDFKTLKQKRKSIIEKIGQNKKEQSSFLDKIDSQATLKLMDGTK